MTGFTHLPAAAYRRMPWKNGLGTTREIAVFPADAGSGTGGFLWRLSIADIERDCDFSAFPGISRTIMLLRGDGMRLNFGTAEPVTMNAPFEPVDFDGGRSAHCILRAGPVRDFNVMSARGRCVHDCVVLRDFPHTVIAPENAQTAALVCLHGWLELRTDGERLRLASEDALLLSPGSKADIMTATAGAAAAFVSFTALP